MNKGREDKNVKTPTSYTIYVPARKVKTKENENRVTSHNTATCTNTRHKSALQYQ
jgi:hypothetical protein